MKVTDVLSILENEVLPQNVRNAARALLIAMLALDRYGHGMSYTSAGPGGSDAALDRGLAARTALEEIRNLAAAPPMTAARRLASPPRGCNPQFRRCA